MSTTKTAVVKKWEKDGWKEVHCLVELPIEIKKGEIIKDANNQYFEIKKIKKTQKGIIIKLEAVLKFDEVNIDIIIPEDKGDEDEKN